MIAKLRDIRVWVVLLSLALIGSLIAVKLKSGVELDAKLTSINQQLETIQAQLADERENYSQIREELRRTRQQFCEAVSTGECGTKP